MEGGFSSDDFADLGPDFNQIISLDGREYAHTIHGFEVNIHSSTSSAIEETDTGSSKVKISTVTNQNWELPTHYGRIVASNNQYLSYVLEGRNGYVLRLIHQETNNRVLLKSFVGAIVDVAFYHANSNLLACVDEGGNLYIWDLDKSEEDGAQVQANNLKIKVQHSPTPDGLEHRLIWSPHVSASDDEEEEQEICNIVLTHGSDIEVLDIHEIFSTYSAGSSVPNLCCGCHSICAAHEKSIHDLSLSPDGSVLATVSEDGHLKFWQVNWGQEESEQPKCLHDFVPHNGAPVTRLIFCDNHLSEDPHNQYWRFLITAAKNNSEVKIWCAVNWKCLQTMRFLLPRSIDNGVEPRIILSLDLSASYLIVTDCNRKALLILQLVTSAALGDASVTSVTEYLLTQPVFSFTVSRCVPLPTHAENDEYSGEESGEEEERSILAAAKGKRITFDSRRNTVLIELHCVHTRSMQSLLVRFEPPDVYGAPPSKERISGFSHDNTVSELLVDVATVPPLQQPLSLPSDLLPGSEGASFSTFQSLPSLNKFNSSPKLLTPSEFMSPSKSDVAPDSTLLSPASIVASASGDHILTSADTSLPPSDFTPAPADTSLPSSDVSADTSLDAPADTSLPPIDHTPAPADTSLPPIDHTPAPADTSLPPIDHTPTPADTSFPPSDHIPAPADTSIPSSDHIPAPADASLPVNPQDVSDVQTNFSSDTQPTLTSVTPELQPKAPLAESEELPIDEMQKAETVVENECAATVSEQVDVELPSADDSRKTFDSIMEILAVKKPDIPDGDDTPGKSATFDEFKELLSNPDKLQQQEEELEVVGGLGRDDAPIESENSGPPINSTPSHPDAVNEPQLNKTEEETIHESNIEEAKSDWPDIGAAEQKEPESGASEKCNFSQVGMIRSNLSNEFYQPDDQKSERRLLMPSAIADVQEFGLEVNNLVELSSSTPDLLDEPPSEVKQSLDIEEGSAKSKSKSRKRSKKSKAKQAPVPLVTEVLSHSFEAKPADTVDLPSGESAVNGASVVATSSDKSEQLIQLLLQQQSILMELKNEQQQKFESLQDQLVLLRTSLLEEQKVGFAEMKIEHQQKLDRVMKDKQALDKQRQDKLITVLSGTLTTAVNAKLDKLVKIEMKNSVFPAIQQSIASLHEKIFKSNAEQWTTGIKAGIAQLTSSKDFPEAISASLMTSLQRTLPGVCEEVFRSSVVESFEKSCQEMFRQVDEAFRQGIMEYMSQLQQQQVAVNEPTLRYLVSSVDSLQSTVRKSLESSHLQAVLQEITGLSHQIKETLAKTVSDAVCKEISPILEVHSSRIVQQERTDKKEEVQKLIHSQSYNSAFEVALSTSDLQLVTYLCQQLDPDVVFEKTPCALSQPVLLSLIQQLSVNLQDNLELKLKYLDQSLLALDTHNDVTKKHMCSVIKELSEQILAVYRKIQADPNFNNAGIIKQVKRLLMVSQQLQVTH